MVPFGNVPELSRQGSILMVSELEYLIGHFRVYAIKEAIPHAGHTHDGTFVLIDDYREAYFWLRDNTDDDARILVWWDYGYPITGIPNRLLIADGNTSNHEHIAFLGQTLTSPEKEAHRVARHLADYVLEWSKEATIGPNRLFGTHSQLFSFEDLCKEPK